MWGYKVKIPSATRISTFSTKYQGEISRALKNQFKNLPRAGSSPLTSEAESWVSRGVVRINFEIVVCTDSFALLFPSFVKVFYTSLRSYVDTVGVSPVVEWIDGMTALLLPTCTYVGALHVLFCTLEWVRVQLRWYWVLQKGSSNRSRTE